jgi:hyperosmotically inducible periplasmic protein
MSNQPTLRRVALLVALAAVAATALAMNESRSSEPQVPFIDEPSEAAPVAEPVEPAPVTDMSAHEIAPVPDEETAARVTAREAKPAPVVAKEVSPPSTPQPPITVEEQRLTEDERIQVEVMEALANDARLSGKIAVVTRDAEVWLSGHTMTANQAWHAGRDAGRVKGVRYVHNEISFRLGRSL